MDVAEVLPHSGACSLSPDGRCLAVAQGRKLHLRSVPSLEDIRTCSCTGAISAVEWAPDSTMVFAACYSQATVHVWSVAHPDWSSTVHEDDVGGLVHATWAPDSSHVLLSSDHRLRVTIWNVTSSQSPPVHIPLPKHPIRALSFSPNHLLLAALHSLPSNETMPPAAAPIPLAATAAAAAATPAGATAARRGTVGNTTGDAGNPVTASGAAGAPGRRATDTGSHRAAAGGSVGTAAVGSAAGIAAGSAVVRRSRDGSAVGGSMQGAGLEGRVGVRRASAAAGGAGEGGGGEGEEGEEGEEQQGRVVMW
ncbi:hypothetical protein CLOM_g10730 [Closterium sp. NIES-68]|nr:hypothetical protein CLOM_g10730 [Closterium sp. NIES-68]